MVDINQITIRKVCNHCEGCYITYIPSKNEARLQLKEMISARVNLILKIKNIITDSIRKTETSPTEYSSAFDCRK